VGAARRGSVYRKSRGGEFPLWWGVSGRKTARKSESSREEWAEANLGSKLNDFQCREEESRFGGK